MVQVKNSKNVIIQKLHEMNKNYLILIFSILISLTTGIFIGKTGVTNNSTKQTEINVWSQNALPKDFSTDDWTEYKNKNLSFKYPPQLHVCIDKNILSLAISENANSDCKSVNLTHFSKNLVGTKLNPPILFNLNGLPVIVISGIAMGSSERFIFANIEYQSVRFIFEMKSASDDNFPLFYQILSTIKLLSS